MSESRFDQEDYWKRGFEDARVKLEAAESRVAELERECQHARERVEDVASDNRALLTEREELREALQRIVTVTQTKDFAGRFQMVWAGSVAPELNLDTEASQSFLRLLNALTPTTQDQSESSGEG